MSMSFLQSREWEEIQRKIGRPVKRLGPVLVIRHDLAYGFNYLYSPRPQSLSKDFFDAAEKYAREQGSIFLKVDPDSFEPQVWAGGRPALSLQSEQSAVVDCRINENDLFATVHPKTRYNIRVAMKHGVSVSRFRGEEAEKVFDSFWGIMRETAKRDNFFLHPEKHYRALFEVGNENFKNELWLAERRGEVIAAAIVNWFLPASAATYLHGASSDAHREVMAPHLLHWEIIREVRRQGFSQYDLGGIDEVKWPGLTRFKNGFGGATLKFPESRDFVFRPALYQLYRFQHKLRHLA